MPRRNPKSVEDITYHLVASLDCLERAFSSWFLQDYVRQNYSAFEKITSEHRSYSTVNHIVWQSTHSCALSLAKVFDRSKSVRSLAKLCAPKLSGNSQFVVYAAKNLHGYCDYCDQVNRVENGSSQTGAQMLPDNAYDECPRFQTQQLNIRYFVRCWEDIVEGMLASDELKNLSDFRSTHIAHSGALEDIHLPYDDLLRLLDKCESVIADGLFLLGRDYRAKVTERKAISEEGATTFWGVFLKGLPQTPA